MMRNWMWQKVGRRWHISLRISPDASWPVGLGCRIFLWRQQMGWVCNFDILLLFLDVQMGITELPQWRNTPTWENR